MILSTEPMESKGERREREYCQTCMEKKETKGRYKNQLRETSRAVVSCSDFHV